MFYCLDANFGLVLKKSSSKSKRLATRSDDLFVPDEEITAFMENYDDSIKNKVRYLDSQNKNFIFALSNLF